MTSHEKYNITAIRAAMKDLYHENNELELGIPRVSLPFQVLFLFMNYRLPMNEKKLEF